MKKITIILSLVPIFIIGFFSFAPEDRINIVLSFYKRMTNDPAQLCFDFKSNVIKDIESARIINSDISTSKILVTYKAQNGFSGFEKNNFKCELTNGILDKKKTILEDYRVIYYETTKVKDKTKEHSDQISKDLIEVRLAQMAGNDNLISLFNNLKLKEKDIEASLKLANANYEIAKFNFNTAESEFNKAHH